MGKFAPSNLVFPSLLISIGALHPSRPLTARCRSQNLSLDPPCQASSSTARSSRPSRPTTWNACTPTATTTATCHGPRHEPRTSTAHVPIRQTNDTHRTERSTTEQLSCCSAESSWARSQKTRWPGIVAQLALVGTRLRFHCISLGSLDF
jgi:hypothetical protein